MNQKVNQYNISKLIDGNRQEFKKLYTDFFDILYNLSFQYIHSKNVAEEISQDAFLKLWEIRSTLTPETNVRGFLYVLVRNKCLNYLRDHKIERQNRDIREINEAEFSLNALSELPSDYIEFKECYSRIKAVIDKLPENLKETFLMSRRDGLKYSQIAQKQNISVKAVEARMTKALSFLRTELKDYFPILFIIKLIF